MGMLILYGLKSKVDVIPPSRRFLKLLTLLTGFVSDRSMFQMIRGFTIRNVELISKNKLAEIGVRNSITRIL
jgi:hypothetical protein